MRNRISKLETSSFFFTFLPFLVLFFQNPLKWPEVINFKKHFLRGSEVLHRCPKKILKSKEKNFANKSKFRIPPPIGTYRGGVYSEIFRLFVLGRGMLRYTGISQIKGTFVKTMKIYCENFFF